jgi:hypothetical protein
LSSLSRLSETPHLLDYTTAVESNKHHGSYAKNTRTIERRTS